MYYKSQNRCEWFVLYSITILCFFGATYTSKLLVIPETGYLEIIFLFSTAIAAVKFGVNQIAFIISLFSMMYLFYSLVCVKLITHANIIDFVQAYKSYYYLILLGFFYKRRIFNEGNIISFFKILSYFFLFKYSLDKFVLHIDRPTLLIENNFELIMLILTYYFVNIIKNKPDVVNTIIITIICFISGSRSSIMALMIVIVFSLNRRLNIKTIIYFLVIPIVAILAIVIFRERLSASGSGTSIESIDRYRFFLEFLYSTSKWPWWQYLTGSTAITPLSPVTCSNLAYYKSLFSYSGNGQCYSVILHSFLLRVIYDHGLIGLVFLLSSIWLYLQKFRVKHKLCIIFVLMATALSVSSLNNVYVAFSLILFIGSATDFTKKTIGRRGWCND